MDERTDDELEQCYEDADAGRPFAHTSGLRAVYELGRSDGAHGSPYIRACSFCGALGDAAEACAKCPGTRPRAPQQAAPHTLPWSHLPDITAEMRQAYTALRAMTEEQRGRVLCWFCDDCRRYVGPGDHCTCSRDE
jgi:hypothetical protein